MPPSSMNATSTDGNDQARQTLQREKSFLVVVDVQEKLLAPMAGREKLVAHCVLLIELAKILQLPVLLTTQYSRRLGPPVAELTGLLPGIEPIDKLDFSCFANDEFAATSPRLAASRTTVLLCGIETHICVMQTALGALTYGYIVHVASDAVASRGAWDWEIGLERMRNAGAVISSTETIIYELLGAAGTDEFKRMLKYLRV